MLNDDQSNDNGSDDLIGQQTQPDEMDQTQAVDQPSQAPVNERLWGALMPCNQHCTPVEFNRRKLVYKVGRHGGGLNDVILPGFKVSNEHCIISWDGVDGDKGCVTVTDMSSNGTFINNTKIGKGGTKILREGNEIAFGTVTPQSPESREDYRFIFRFFAAGKKEQGLYAHYDMAYELGKGAFATVMQVMSRAEGQFYAAKIIHPRVVGTPEEAKNRELQLDREIDIMAKLRHPNIVAFKEMFKAPDGGRHLVIELITGGDLLDFIIKDNVDGVPEEIAKHISYQMCDALAYCHSMQIAHRDLKPENILLTTDRPWPQVKIADFGLAKVADSATMLRTMCGTPSYLAPEVVSQKNASGYGHIVDSWSIGVIVFCLLTNSTPFLEDENLDVSTRILQRTINWDWIRAKPVSENALWFIQNFLDNNPETRMTCSLALVHPWLQSYVPQYNYADYPGYQPPADREGQAALTRDLSMMPPLDQDALPSSQGSAKAGAPIQRRSEILSQQIDNGEVRDVELPAGMIANYAAATGEAAGTANGDTEIVEDGAEVADGAEAASGSGSSNSNGKRSLSPMAEDPDDDAMDIASPRKKARGSNEEMDVQTPYKAGKGKAGRGGAKKISPDGLRRSGRNAKGKGR